MAEIALNAATDAAASIVSGATLEATFDQAVDQLTDEALKEGQRFAEAFLQQKLFGDRGRSIEGPRLRDLSVQSSAFGRAIPAIFGTMRVAGNVIWSQPISEVATTSTTSAKGGGNRAPTRTTTNFSYFATMAIAVCEGEIDEIVRVWADAEVLDLAETSINYRVYKGTSSQTPDSIIESFEGVGATPAYRDMAYVVVEDFPLANYGNRIPNFNFEVLRKAEPADPDERTEELIKAVTLIPGSGEYVYDTTIQQKLTGEFINGDWRQGQVTQRVNQNNQHNKSDLEVALDNLEQTCPNLEYVGLVVSWFGDSLDAGTCTVRPKVDFQGVGTITPDEWQVGSLTRSTAQLIGYDDGRARYGGTPSDVTITRCIAEIKSRGWKVALYPFILMDTADKPWRGRITGSASDVTSFFTKTNGYNAFINHYLTLCGDDVDLFVIGSELKGLTAVQDVDDSFPGVDALVSLAATAQANVAAATKVTYAADWSEYHHTENGWFNLDPLWASSDIDVIGIDAYFPLTDQAQDGYSTQQIIDGWTSGEHYDFIYDDETRTTTSTIADEFAIKNIAYWWSNTHTNPDDVDTAWVPESKKIWFTEYGFPSVDGAANQPNVFYDPNSTESAFPHHSLGQVDIRAQRTAITGTELQWQNSTMVERMFLWTWDARPYPFWPDLGSVWSDGASWATGHWVQGKLGVSSLGAAVEDIFQRVGLTSADYDTSLLTNLVEGYVLQQQQKASAALAALQRAYFFDVVESDGTLKCIPRGNDASATISEAALVRKDEDDVEALQIIRLPEATLPHKVDVTFYNKRFDYQVGTQHSRRQTVDSEELHTINLPVVMHDQLARTVADIALYDYWAGRTRMRFRVSNDYAAYEPGDVVTLTTDDATYTLRIAATKKLPSGAIEVDAIADEKAIYNGYVAPEVTSNEPALVIPGGQTALEFLDLPALPGESPTQAVLSMAINAVEEGWEGAQINRSIDGGTTYDVILSVDDAATRGVATETLGSGSTYLIDESTSIDVLLQEGTLESTTLTALLNGANAALLGDEIIQFQTATLIAENKYTLTNLMRGQLGTEDAVGTHEAGERFILLNTINQLNISFDTIGLSREFKPVTFGEALEDTNAQSYTYTGANLKPYAPVNVVGTRDGSSNLTITWNRRDRLLGAWRDNSEIGLSEQEERYEVDILNGAGDTVLRTITGLTSPTASYSAAEQTTDFGSAQSSINVKIYQISAIVGRGKEGAASV